MEKGVLKLRLLKVADVATILNVSKPHVYNLIAAGNLACVYVGESRRVRPEDLEQYIEDNLNMARNQMGLE